jgi:hypothetical protein
MAISTVRWRLTGDFRDLQISAMFAEWSEPARFEKVGEQGSANLPGLGKSQNANAMLVHSQPRKFDL